MRTCENFGNTINENVIFQDSFYTEFHFMITMEEVEWVIFRCKYRESNNEGICQNNSSNH